MHAPNLTFAEKPVTGDEKKVAEIIEAYLSCHNAHKKNEFSSLFAPKATLESRIMKGYILPIDYMETMEQNNYYGIRRVGFYDTVIRIAGENANVYGNLIIFSGGRKANFPYRFSLIKEQDTWLVTATRYL